MPLLARGPLTYALFETAAGGLFAVMLSRGIL